MTAPEPPVRSFSSDLGARAALASTSSAPMSDAGVVDGVRAVSSGASSSVRPIFGLETLERSAAGSRGGFITSCSAASACVLVGTTAGSCVLYDFAAGSRREVDCAAASPASRAAVSRVWLAPDARHALVLLRDADDDRLLGLHGHHWRLFDGRSLVSPLLGDRGCVGLGRSIPDVLGGLFRGLLRHRRCLGSGGNLGLLRKCGQRQSKREYEGR